MTFRAAALATAAVLATALACAPAQTTSQTPHTFTTGPDTFLLDGKPFLIHAGEMHYPRVPRAYWRDRMRKMKAMGLNTLTTYVFWNEHETAPGTYDFTGDNDLAEYLKEAQQEGLYVILRPGPYVCAEWEFAGYPAWLLKDHDIVVRSSDPKYMEPVNKWFAHLGPIVHPFLLSQGGPILAVQIENEYGSFGDDHAYMEQMRQLLIATGMGDGLLYTADGPDVFAKGTLPNIPAVVNFGPGDAAKAFPALAAFRPNGPLMSGEYWDGWFDHWGDKHQHRSNKVQLGEIGMMLDKGYSFNLYMAEGGTSFGWMNGSNSDGKNFEPDTTSYDYDSAIDERGGLRPKFFAIRDLIAKSTGVTPPAPPAEIPATTYPVRTITESASLWANLPKLIKSDKPLSMEDIGQSYGYILYTTPLTASQSGTLTLDALHDYAQVYLDHKLIGILDRRISQSSLELPPHPAGELQILVENTGRVNYTTVIRTERKGITKSVTLAGTELHNFQIYPLPMQDTTKLKYTTKPCEGPCFYRTHLTTTGDLRDTYINTTQMTKGFVWVNGRPLGRAWSIGPQGALYLPAPWLHAGENEITLFELQSSTNPDQLGTVDHPIYFEPTPPSATASTKQ
ncbi:glycoside hydrolase family 35 protein [Granulicella sibirica]|uniref:Beta-galactosidase n=1 Tax=Granulicella sibirica TaxID=2479048 RepID=A0A4Q0T8H7_9BACT|nr:glycoside hydrolase family 35 protein [Granulicella sibirica]RXH58339.1 Beta-galactosidase [Granulicella sibirica]